MPVRAVTQEIVGSDDLFDWLRLTAPAPDPIAAFFRIELPAP